MEFIIKLLTLGHIFSTDASIPDDQVNLQYFVLIAIIIASINYIKSNPLRVAKRSLRAGEKPLWNRIQMVCLIFVELLLALAIPILFLKSIKSETVDFISYQNIIEVLINLSIIMFILLLVAEGISFKSTKPKNSGNGTEAK